MNKSLQTELIETANPCGLNYEKWQILTIVNLKQKILSD